MRTLKSAVTVALGLCFTLCAAATEPPKPAVRQAKVSWRDLPGVDGRKHSLADLDSREVVVVAITCNHCPIALEYHDRMKEFARRCGPEAKVALVAISLSDLETDRLPRMKEVAKRQAFNFPYLRDESEQIGKDLGATRTPQFFVLDRNRAVAYRGAWDNDLNVSKVTRQYVTDAVDALLAGKLPPVAETQAKGCHIDYKE